MLHIAVDAVGIKHSGGAMVLNDFIETALNDDRISKLTLFCSSKKDRNFNFPRSAKLVEREKPYVDKNYLVRILWSQSLLRRECSLISADILFCMTGIARGYGEKYTVTFIQQSLPFSEEALRTLSIYKNVKFSILRMLMKRSCNFSDKVFVQTETMRKSIALSFGISSSHIEVFPATPPCLDNNDVKSNIYHLMDVVPEYARFLYIGNSENYKNLEIVAKSIDKVRTFLPNATLFVTLPKEHYLCNGNTVVGMGYLGRSELYRAYSLASILIMPSLIETVGLPMLEAMSLGIPVLAADRPYAHDICGNAAIFFNPLSAADFLEKLSLIVFDMKLRKELIQKGYTNVESLIAYQPYQKMLNRLIDIAEKGNRKKQ